MNELGVVLVYLRLTCSLLNFVLVKVGYNATSSAHFWPEICLNYARFCKLCHLILKLFVLQNEKNKSKKHIAIV